MKMLLGLLIFFSISITQAGCLYQNGFEDLIFHADEFLLIGKKEAIKLLNIQIPLDGTGKVSVYQDENGNIIGVGLEYDGDDKLQEVLNYLQFNKGETIKYTSDDIKPEDSPLVLGLKPGTKIDPITGGTFRVTILTELDPKKSISYDLDLKKDANNQWRVYRGDWITTSAVISPKIRWGWRGTFSGIEFK